MTEGNKLVTIVPSALKPTSDPAEIESLDGEGTCSSGVNMSLVNTTSRLDLETRWMVQWEGERIHPILVSDIERPLIRDETPFSFSELFISFNPARI
jgi:hypothetical protein